MNKPKTTSYSDTIIGKYLMRRISKIFTTILLKTPISANQITIFGFMLYITAASFFAKGGVTLCAFGAFFLFIGNILDFVDGEVARAKNTCSDFGYWLDVIVDRIGQVLIILGIFLGQYTYLKINNILFIGWLSVFNIIIIEILITYKTKMMNVPSLKIGKIPHFGFTDFIFFIAFFAIINKLIIVLYISALIFPIVWIKSIVNIINNYKKQ